MATSEAPKRPGTPKIALMIIAGLFAFSGSCIQLSISFGSTRYLSDVRLGTTTSGAKVLVASEAIKVARGGMYTRFEILDAATGKKLSRIAPWLWGDSSERRGFFGGAGTRQWWTGTDGQPILIDFETGKLVADESDVLAHNPELLGEFQTARVADDGALVVRGGDGKYYAIDINTLKGKVVDQKASLGSWRGKSLDYKGSMVRRCRTITQGPCGGDWMVADETKWSLSVKDLDGDSLLTVEDSDEHTAYLYVADDSLWGTFMGGVYLYAVDIGTGKIRWHSKL